MTVKRIDLELFPASLETMHVYTAVSSTVGAKMTRDPDDSNLKGLFKKILFAYNLKRAPELLMTYRDQFNQNRKHDS